MVIVVWVVQTKPKGVACYLEFRWSSVSDCKWRGDWPAGERSVPPCIDVTAMFRAAVAVFEGCCGNE